LQKDIYLLMGRFHLLADTDTKVREVINNLKVLGVRKIAPSHCAGEKVIALFREAWARISSRVAAGHHRSIAVRDDAMSIKAPDSLLRSNHLNLFRSGITLSRNRLPFRVSAQTRGWLRNKQAACSGHCSQGVEHFGTTASR